MTSSNSLWEVVGGAAKGGLIVREGREQGSAELPGRLSTGALVLPLEHDVEAERLLYELVEGVGPERGWVSTAFKGKALIVPAEDDISTEEAGSVEDSMTDELSSEEMSSTEDAAGLAMQLYCARFGAAEAEDEELASPSSAPRDDAEEPADAEACAQLAQDLSMQDPTSEAAEESDDVETSHLTLCRHCRLPVGKVAYHAEEGQEGVLHGECVAQCMLRELQKAEEKRKQEATEEKAAQRAEYEIGWRAAEHLPSNAGPAARLSCGAPQGMCCLVLDEETRSVSLASTVEPAAAVNLEYLSTALEVRRRENREPLFSLDPVDAESEFFDPKRSMLVKRFEPSWLAGTSVGEVLFQSDYHLKELSMGDYEQPVVGMKSCHDFSCDGPEWSAREWFVVRKAEVRRSGDNVLMPFVKMGVEAREQIRGQNGLEDVLTTKPNHPLVKYAEMFTHNFDLIAERKSVVYHLRELAKASVLAKFLMEADVDLDDSWFSMASDETEACCLEIPQLWNDRSHSQIRVQDGAIVNADSAFNASSNSLYGGVQFGLDKFQLSGARQPARMMSAGLAARQFVQPARHLSATLSAGLATRQFQRSFGPMGVQPARVSAGVGLDKFALSGARQPARMMSAGLAARQFVQPARHLSATLSAGLATRQFQRSFGPMGVQPARVSAGVGLDKFALSGARQPARMMSAGLAARQFVQPARHLSATLSAGLATRQFQRSFGPMGVQPARVSAGVGLDKFALSGARQPARMMSAGLAARQFVQPARHLSATLSAGLATRQFQRSFGPMGVQPARVSAGVGLDKFALSGARQPARMMSAGLAARQFVQPARHLSATLSAGLATRQFQRSFGPMGVQPARVSAGVGLDKFALSGARQPARMMSAGLAARQFVQPARHLSATLSAGLATRQFQRSFGPMGVQPARVSAGVGLDKFALSGARQPARMMSAGLAARQFVQPARHLSATLSAGLATRQFQRSFGPMGVQPARVSAGVGLDKFALSGARQPARMMSAGLAARQFVQPARHLSATLSAGLATRQFQRSFGPMGVQPARVSAGVGLDKFALSGARQPARMMSAGLAARQFVQPARHLSATLSAGLATRQFQRSFGPMGVQPARVSAGVGLDKFALSGARQPARMMSAGLAARQFVQPARHLSATLSAGLATRQFQRSFGPMGVQPARVSAGVGLDKFALSGARQPARMMSAGLAARQFVQPARHLSATLSAGLATRQFQRSFGPMGVQPARVSAGVGLDKFALSGARQPARMMSAGLAARQFVQPARHLSATLSAGLATRQFQRSFGPMGVQPARVAGVDLNLDEFNLSAPSEDARDIFVQLDAGADISTAFWSNLSKEFPSMFTDEDKDMLNKVFNPCLSDRREDGECFIPPDTSFAYVQKLRSLVKEEEAMQQQRREHFLSKTFVASEPGPLFPSTWASSVEISREDGAGKRGALDARPEYKAQAHMFEQALKTAVPVFDKTAEDGARFRIYRIGSLEVRTTQDHDGQEAIGMVFSTRSSTEPSKKQPLKDGEKIMKATEYVERVAKGHHYYVVMETDANNVIVAEQLADGSMKHEENPKNLEDRNSLAKVFRSADCSRAEMTLGNVKGCQKNLYSMLCGC